MSALSSDPKRPKRSQIQLGAAGFGVVFLLVGVAGFIPGVTAHHMDMAFAGRGSTAKLVGHLPGLGPPQRGAPALRRRRAAPQLDPAARQELPLLRRHRLRGAVLLRDRHLVRVAGELRAVQRGRQRAPLRPRRGDDDRLARARPRSLAGPRSSRRARPTSETSTHAPTSGTDRGCRLRRPGPDRRPAEPDRGARPRLRPRVDPAAGRPRRRRGSRAVPAPPPTWTARCSPPGTAVVVERAGDGARPLGAYVGVPVSYDEQVVSVLSVCDELPRTDLAPRPRRAARARRAVVDRAVPRPGRRADVDPVAIDLARGLERGEVVPWYQPVVDLRHRRGGRRRGARPLAPRTRRGRAAERLHPGGRAVGPHPRRRPRGAAARASPTSPGGRDAAPASGSPPTCPTRHLGRDGWLDAAAGRGRDGRRGPDHGHPRAHRDRAPRATRRRPRPSSTRCADLGFHVWFDDFGSGWSALSDLSRFTVDGIKIDRSYADQLGTKTGEVVIAALVSAAAELGLSVTIEGIETPVAVRARPQPRLPLRPGLPLVPPRPPGRGRPLPLSPARAEDRPEPSGWSVRERSARKPPTATRQAGALAQSAARGRSGPAPYGGASGPARTRSRRRPGRRPGRRRRRPLATTSQPKVWAVSTVRRSSEERSGPPDRASGSMRTRSTGSRDQRSVGPSCVPKPSTQTRTPRARSCVEVVDHGEVVGEVGRGDDQHQPATASRPARREGAGDVVEDPAPAQVAAGQRDREQRGARGGRDAAPPAGRPRAAPRCPGRRPARSARRPGQDRRPAQLVLARPRPAHLGLVAGDAAAVRRSTTGSWRSSRSPASIARSSPSCSRWRRSSSSRSEASKTSTRPRPPPSRGRPRRRPPSAAARGRPARPARWPRRRWRRRRPRGRWRARPARRARRRAVRRRRRRRPPRRAARAARRTRPRRTARPRRRRARSPACAGRGHEHLVPGGVAEGVVDLLEAVEVDEEQPDDGAAALGPAERAAHQRTGLGPVRQAGEAVVGGLVGEGEPGRLALRVRGLDLVERQLHPGDDQAEDGDRADDDRPHVERQPERGLDRQDAGRDERGGRERPPAGSG